MVADREADIIEILSEKLRTLMPHVIVISGPNGAGKTTAAPALLNDALRVNHFVNADKIAEGLSAFSPEKAAIQAGRAMLTRMQYLADQNENFAFETTLASRSFAPWITTLKEKNYRFHLIFLLLDKAELAVSRVTERVKLGGHFVPESTIRRRYTSGLKNFFQLYKPIADSWQMYDNTNMKDLSLIGSKMTNKVEIFNHKLWDSLKETYNERPKK